MNEVLRKRLIAAGGAGALAIAGMLSQWYEGRRYTVYQDPVGISTVCDGITGPDVIKGKRYSDAECNALGAKHLAVAQAAARRQLVHFDQYTPWRQGALIDFTYNVGEAKLRDSTMRKLFNTGNDEAACKQLALWAKARVGGVLVVLRGLVPRRADEQELCLNGAVP